MKQKLIIRAIIILVNKMLPKYLILYLKQLEMQKATPNRNK